MHILLFLFAASIPLTDLSRSLLGGPTVPEMLLVILALTSASQLYESPLKRLNRACGLLTIIACLSGISFLWNMLEANIIVSDYSVSIKAILRSFEYSLVCLVISTTCQTYKHLQYLASGLWTGAVIASGIAILHWVLGPNAAVFWSWGPSWVESYRAEDFRVWGSFCNPLSLVAYLSPFLGMSLSRLSKEISFCRKMFYCLSSSVFIMVLFVTGSRVSILVISLAFLFSVVNVRRLGVQKLLLLASVLVIIAITCHFGEVASVLDSRTRDEKDVFTSAEQRTYTAVSSLRMIVDHPLLGVGPGNFPDAYSQGYISSFASTARSSFTPENFILLLASENGLPAVVLVAWVIVRAVMFGFNWKKRPSCVDTNDPVARDISVAMICFLAVGMIQAESSASECLLLYTLVSFQEAKRLNVENTGYAT